MATWQSVDENTKHPTTDPNIGDGRLPNKSQGDLSLANLAAALPRGAGSGEGQADKKMEAVEAGSAAIEDMMTTLHKQLQSSDWLKQNTAEKWVTENPDVAQEIMDIAKDSGVK